MSRRISQSGFARFTVALAVMALATAEGCSKADDDPAGAAVNGSSQARAIELSLTSAQAAHEHAAPGTAMPGMAQEEAGAGAGVMAMGGPTSDGPLPIDVGSPAGSAPGAMTRLLGLPPAPATSASTGGLPAALGAPHIYHLAAETFFLDQAAAIALTIEQQKKLTALREKSMIAYATTQRRVDQGEQDLWVLSSAEAPDIAKIEQKIGEITHLAGEQRMAFVRTVGEAVGVLSDVQRRAVAAQGAPSGATATPPAPSAAGMVMGASAPPAGGMKMKMKMGMDKGAAGMPDAGAAAGMGHM